MNHNKVLGPHDLGLNNPVMYVDPSGEATVGGYISVDFDTPGVAGSASIGLVADDDGNYAFIYTESTGVGTLGSVSVDGHAELTTADTVIQLAGESKSMSISSSGIPISLSGPEGVVRITTAENYNGASIGGGWAAGAPVSVTATKNISKIIYKDSMPLWMRVGILGIKNAYNYLSGNSGGKCGGK